jgi:DNA-directed RNA polymerase specialized sigma subunit
MAENPVSTFLTAHQQLGSTRRSETQELWHKWDQQGRTPEHLDPLIQNFSGLVGAKVKEWKPPTIPKSAFEAELTKHLILAFEGYNPSMGVSLNTHVNHRIQKAKRYMAQQQNMARMNEGQVFRIGAVRRAQDELGEQFGRAPTPHEIAAHMTENDQLGRKHTPKQVASLITAIRRDIPSSSWESDPEPKQLQRQHEILPLLRDTLNEHETKVFDHVFGHNGAPVISSTGQLATRLGMSPSQVSRIKTSIAAKYNKYI